MMDYSEKIAELAKSPYADLFKTKPKQQNMTADDRLLESFEEIKIFYHNHGHVPHINSSDMKEKLLAARLKGLRQDKNKKAMLTEKDPDGILEDDMEAPKDFKELEKNFGSLFKGAKDLFNVSSLPNNGRVKRTVENDYEVTRREQCPNFDSDYKDAFNSIRINLENGQLKTVKFVDIDQMQPGGYYVYKSELCYVVSFDEVEQKAGYSQQRITVVFENKTMSHMYRRSLAQRLYEDSGFAVVDKDALEQQKLEAKITGHIYILRSKSMDDKIATIKDLYKIGMVENESVASRIANAKNEPTYLMADVEVVNTYRVEGFNTQKLENLIHKFFGGSQLEVEIIGSDGKPYHPREWYCVPYEVIDQTIHLISSGEIINYYYDQSKQKLVKKS
jgi:hypothetical protein